MKHINRSTVILAGCGALLAAVLACGPASSGGEPTSSGGGAATEAPATQATGGQGSNTSPMPAVQPCTIVTQDEATAFFGVPSGAGDGSTGSLTAECDYRSTDNTDGLSLILQYVPDGALKSSAFTYMTQGGQAVPNLGEGAFWETAGNLDVAKGNWILTLNGAMGGKNVGADKLTPLAQTAVGRLP